MFTCHLHDYNKTFGYVTLYALAGLILWENQSEQISYLSTAGCCGISPAHNFSLHLHMHPTLHA